MTSFKKSDSQRIVVTRTEFRGVDLVDVRVQLKKGDDWIMTKAGIQIPADDYDDFLDFLCDVGIPKKPKAEKPKEEPVKAKASSKERERETSSKRKTVKDTSSSTKSRTKINPRDFD